MGVEENWKRFNIKSVHLLDEQCRSSIEHRYEKHSNSHSHTIATQQSKKDLPTTHYTLQLL